MESRARLGARHLRITLAHLLRTSCDHHRGRDHGLSTVILTEAALVPRPRRAAALHDVGRHALARGTRTHCTAPLARDLAGGGLALAVFGFKCWANALRDMLDHGSRDATLTSAEAGATEATGDRSAY